MILDKLFQLMSEKNASDIFISAGAPIHIKIQGNTIPVNQQVMLPDMIEKIAYELMSPDQIKTFEANWEMNLSFGVPNVGNFRVNIFRQRGSTSIVIRFILGNIPALDELGLPNILAGRAVVPEILQDQATPENLAEALVKLYEDKDNAAAVAETFTDIHLQLRRNNAEKAASAVIECLN